MSLCYLTMYQICLNATPRSLLCLWRWQPRWKRPRLESQCRPSQMFRQRLPVPTIWQTSLHQKNWLDVFQLQPGPVYYRLGQYFELCQLERNQWNLRLGQRCPRKTFYSLCRTRQYTHVRSWNRPVRLSGSALGQLCPRLGLWQFCRQLAVTWFWNQRQQWLALFRESSSR